MEVTGRVRDKSELSPSAAAAATESELPKRTIILTAIVVEVRRDELRSMERCVSFSAIQKLLRRIKSFWRAEEQYFGQLALDPRDDVAFENQFQSRRNHNYGDDFNNTGANYYHDSPAFHNKVQITDVFSQASRSSVENVKRVHRKVTQVVSELPDTAARIAETDVIPAFVLGLVLSAIISSFGNLIQSIRRDRFRRYQKMQRSGQRTLTEREEALVEIEREFSEMALAEWKTATREELFEIPKQFWILCNALRRHRVSNMGSANK